MASAAIIFPTWVPSSAKTVVLRRWDEFPDCSDRERLTRFATQIVMKTHVWAKLPKSPVGLEGEVIDSAFRLSHPESIRYLIDLVAGRPTSMKDLEQAHQAIITHAAALKSALRTLAAESRAYGESAEHMVPAVDFAGFLTMLNDIERFSIEQERERLGLQRSLPKLRRLNDGRIGERLFSTLMTQDLLRLYGVVPKFPVVVALTEVAFNIPGEVEVDTVRHRWDLNRKQTAPGRRKLR